MARSFNGTSDFVQSNTAYSIPAAVTMSCWFKPGTLSNSYSAVMSHAATGPVAFVQILIKSTGKMAYYVQASGVVDVDPGSATPSGWTHAALTYDSTNGLKTYINGVSDGTAAANGAAATGTQYMTFGEDIRAGSRFLPGSIADCAEWNISLSTLEISALAQGARPPYIRRPNLVGWWPLDGLQSPEPDLSLNANNGTLTGTALAFGPPIMLFTPRWPVQFVSGAASSFSPYWAINSNMIVEGVAS